MRIGDLVEAVVLGAGGIPVGQGLTDEPVTPLERIGVQVEQLGAVARLGVVGEDQLVRCIL